MKRSRAILIGCALVALTACSDQEPAATGFKKTLAQTAANGSGNATPTPSDPSAKPPTGTTPPPASGAPAPTAPKGDKALGQAFFTRASCGAAGCHGPDGKGATPLGEIGNYDAGTLTAAKESPQHKAVFPTAAADVSNLIAFLNSLTP